MAMTKTDIANLRKGAKDGARDGYGESYGEGFAQGYLEGNDWNENYVKGMAEGYASGYSKGKAATKRDYDTGGKYYRIGYDEAFKNARNVGFDDGRTKGQKDPAL